MVTSVGRSIRPFVVLAHSTRVSVGQCARRVGRVTSAIYLKFAVPQALCPSNTVELQCGLDRYADHSIGKAPTFAELRR